MGLHQPAASRTAGYAAAIRKLVIRMATDIPDGRHWRVQSALVRLGHPIAASTVWEILHAAGIGSAPRRTGPTCAPELDDMNIVITVGRPSRRAQIFGSMGSLGLAVALTLRGGQYCGQLAAGQG